MGKTAFNPGRLLRDQAIRRLRAVYYLIGFDRTFPFKERVARIVDEWERTQHKGDAPQEKDAWDVQYAGKSWAYMDALDEASRYAVIVGYLAYLKRGGSILDVGCGEGILVDRFHGYDYARYVGLDISEVAVARLAAKRYPRARFFQADAEAFVPAERFDAIIFNESLYYFRQPLAALLRYADSLQPDGVIIVSTYMGSRRARVILQQIRKRFRIIDETMTTQGAKSWACSVLAPVTVRSAPPPVLSEQYAGVEH